MPDKLEVKIGHQIFLGFSLALSGEVALSDRVAVPNVGQSLSPGYARHDPEATCLYFAGQTKQKPIHHH